MKPDIVALELRYTVETDFGDPVEITPSIDALVRAYFTCWVEQNGSPPRLDHPLVCMNWIIVFPPAVKTGHPAAQRFEGPR